MRSKLTKIMLGVAVADAVGNHMEFNPQPRAEDFDTSWGAQELVASDDTQMSMFSLESLINGAPFSEAYSRWYVSQQSKHGYPLDGLLQFPEMFSVQAPGRTCMDSCKAIAAGLIPINDSKGNGTVMRASHLAEWCSSRDLSFADAITLAGTDAVTTHLHPYASQCSKFLVAIHWGLSHGLNLPDSIDLAFKSVKVHSHVSYCIEMRNSYTTEALSSFFGGWVAEEALSLAISAAWTGSDYKDVVRKAATISGDSDTVAAIAGGLAAAMGMEVPEHQVEKLTVLKPMRWLLQGNCN